MSSQFSREKWRLFIRQCQNSKSLYCGFKVIQRDSLDRRRKLQLCQRLRCASLDKRAPGTNHFGRPIQSQSWRGKQFCHIWRTFGRTSLFLAFLSYVLVLQPRWGIIQGCGFSRTFSCISILLRVHNKNYLWARFTFRNNFATATVFSHSSCFFTRSRVIFLTCLVSLQYIQMSPALDCWSWIPNSVSFYCFFFPRARSYHYQLIGLLHSRKDNDHNKPSSFRMHAKYVFQEPHQPSLERDEFERGEPTVAIVSSPCLLKRLSFMQSI